MAENCRFAFAVHVLSALALHHDEVVNSENLARSVNTNAVVIRRLLGELAEAGLVETQRGPGGGSRLAQSADKIDLAQIYRAAVGEISAFGDHPQTPAQSCPVGRGIRRALEEVANRANCAVEREYQATSLADIVRALKED